MKRLRTWAWVLIGLAFVVGVLRAFFFGVYYVDSPSMEPTLHGADAGGDWVLVRYGRGDTIQRYDLVVIVPDGESEPYVKRVLGLPGELVELRGGDLWIDDRIHRSEAGLPVPITIFDDTRHDFAVDWRLGERWSAGEAGWELDASDVPSGAAAGLAFLRLGLSDHFDVPGVGRAEGRVDVADGRLEFDVEVLSGAFVLRAGLRERGDEFEVRIDPSTDGPGRLTLLRRSPAGDEELGTAEVGFGAGRHRIGFENVGDLLVVELDGRRVLEHAYDGNRFHPRDDAKSGMSLPTDRIFLGGRGGRARFSGIRVLRDLHYTPRGEFAVQEALQLGPDELFLLGDNSRDSRDGRDWGPTPLSAVVGRPLRVLWPLERARALMGEAAAADEVVGHPESP